MISYRTERTFDPTNVTVRNSRGRIDFGIKPILMNLIIDNNGWGILTWGLV